MWTACEEDTETPPVPARAAFAPHPPAGHNRSSQAQEPKRWEKIRCLGLEALGEMTLVAEECGCSKPHADIFVMARRALGVDAGQCVLVGDRPEVDILGPQQAGMRAVWISPKASPWSYPSAAPWKTIRAIHELPAILAAEPMVT